MKKVFIPSLPNYSIDILGRVYRLVNGRDMLIENMFQGSKLVVQISGKDYDIFYLMVESFGLTISPTDRIKFRVNRKNKTLALASIRITKIKERAFYNSPEEKEMELYACSKKAGAANARFIEKITALEVYTSLKVQGFKCYYCKTKLLPGNWQLDHFYAKYNGGKNVFANLVASCELCNRMKNTMDPKNFIKRCIAISDNLKHLLHVHNTSEAKNKDSPK